jgi:hypothetical protein
MKLLDAMLEHEPPLPWPRNQYVAAFAVDQCNIWQAAKKTKRGAFRGTERLDADGMPVVIRSTTILNIVQREVPFTMGDHGHVQQPACIKYFRMTMPPA